MVEQRSLVRVFVAFAIVATTSLYTLAQSIPDVPSEISFAGVIVYLPTAVRVQVQQEIRQLYANRRQLEQDMDALRQLTPLWQPYFINANLSVDFRYVALPFVGSETPVYWAIGPQQTTNLRLRIDQVIDERLHPLVTTEAVVAHLKRLQEVYRTNPVQTLLYYLQTDAPRRIMEPSVPNAVQSVLLDANSSPYIWKILARKIAVEREDPAYRPPGSYVLYAYKNGSGQTLADIAQRLNVGLERFRPYNYWLKAEAIPSDSDYSVLIRLRPDEFPAVRTATSVSLTRSSFQPNDTGFPILRKQPNKEQGLRALAVLYAINDKKGAQAQPCDNAITLAYYGDITPKEFLTYNELGEQDVIRPGEIYYLEEKAKRAKVPFHVVQRNQSLRDVSNMYGVRLASLLRFNDILSTQRIRAGRILWLQRKRPRNRPVEYQQLPPEEPTPTPVAPVPAPDLTQTNVQPVPVDTTNQPVMQPVAIPRPSPGADAAFRTPPVIKKSIEPKPAPAVLLNPEVRGLKIHTVKPGQTYYSISKLYGVTPRQLYIWNNLSEEIPLEIGQELVVAPNPKRTVSRPGKPLINPVPQASVPTTQANEQVRYHVVKPGQTVYRVALINGVTVDEVMRWNNLRSYTIETGQRLIIRKPN